MHIAIYYKNKKKIEQITQMIKGKMCAVANYLLKAFE